VRLDNDCRVSQFLEKNIGAGPGLINAGVYLVRKQIVRDLPAKTAISLERDVFPRLLDRGVYGIVCSGPFIDIGIPDDLKRAQTMFGSQVSTSCDLAESKSPETPGKRIFSIILSFRFPQAHPTISGGRQTTEQDSISLATFGRHCCSIELH